MRRRVEKNAALDFASPRLTKAEQHADSLINAWGCSFALLMAVTVLGVPAPVMSIEVVVGGLIVTIAIEILKSDASGAAWIALCIAVYWMARGAQNLSDGFTGRTQQL